jgi:YidC/Oxa1 family membrane protein insertase
LANQNLTQCHKNVLITLTTKNKDKGFPLEQKNLVIAVVLSIAILVGFNYLYEGPKMKKLKEQQQVADQLKQQDNSNIPTPNQQPGIAAPTSEVAVHLDRESALKKSPRIRIESESLTGSIALAGGFIDDVTLKHYQETTEDNSANITMLSPQGIDQPYYANFGWVSTDSAVKMPTDNTVWQSNSTTLTPETPATLYWDNGEGLRFERKISIDNDYMFSIEQRVINNSTKDVQLFQYGRILRTGTPDTPYQIIHEGPLGVFDGKLEEVDYKDIRKENKVSFKAEQSWLGITDKYWLVALAPKPGTNIKATMNHRNLNGNDQYQTDYISETPLHVTPGASASNQSHLFVGAKKLDLLAGYSEKLNIERFDLAIDFGWLYFLTKPLFLLLDFIYGLIGNFGICILLLTVLVRLALFPLVTKQYKSMSKMRILSPEIAKLRERFKDDRMQMNQELMALYKKQKINPMGGCLPILVQIPVFFALYKVLFVSIEMRHAPFFGWIQDLSVPDPTSIINLFGLLPFEPFFALGAWPIIMGITMFLQQRLNPQPADPTQAKVMMFLPLIFTVLLASFPAGLVIYWAWGNVLSIIQQWVILKRTEKQAIKPALAKIKR